MFSLLLREAISGLSEARGKVTLSREDRSAAITVSMLARNMVVSCSNHLFHSLATFVLLDALDPWYSDDCAVDCNSRRFWATAE